MDMNAIYQANLRDTEIGSKVYHEILQEFDNGPELNKQLLMQILQDNKDTEYGKKYNFAEIKSVAEYQQKVPVIIYDDVQEEIERMAAGEQNVLTAYPFKHMNETSGTIGLEKKIPMTDRQVGVFTRYNKHYIDGLKAAFLDEAWMKGRSFCTTEGSHKTLPSGITVGCASSAMADYISGGKEALGAIMNAMFTSPVEAVLLVKGTNTKYIHSRFALMDRDITGITTGFFSTLNNYFIYISSNIEMLIQDIEAGTINEEIAMPEEIRESLLKKIKPMPERAAELREIFKDGSDIGWLSKVWPKLMYLFGAGGDGFSIYDKIITQKFGGGNIKRLYSGVTASEGLWSIPSGIDIEDSIMAPQSAFFEFLPLEFGNDFSKCVTMDQLEVGKTYEIIVTNLCGLYRYRTSDAVKVTGFKGKTPMVVFMYRVNKTVSMVQELTTEKALQVAVETTMDELGVPLSDFSMYPDYENLTYVFLVEPLSETTGVTTDVLAQTLCKNMRIANETFGHVIDKNNLRPPVAYWLQPETAMLYRDMMVYKGASANQIKPVRVISNEQQKKFFFALRAE